ncbi:mycothiol-dependent nitroreductase Rv2466c family protein [Williamsia sp. MIQD14]|uniref:mycothiol-dependent nitroreductase Rv2466c family protein n=1 Tax=Williamsia sp. MIQD14 TaxID=3425703 RepID=UPI003DA027F1
MHIDCHIDPACPFAWATSRWLADVAGRRDDVTLTLRQMSLAVLNADAIAAGDMDPGMAHHMEVSRAGGRLLAAVPGEAFADLYAALGRRIHLDHAEVTSDVARAALTECGLDPDLARAIDDPAHDAAVADAHAEAVAAYGEPSGTPLVTVDGRTFFGPVITEIPMGAAADDLLDALAVVARTPAFAQLQRPRSGPPTLATTQED